MITCTFIGLIFSMLVIFADDRGIVVDDMVSETGTPAWEFAFIIYMLFMTGGVILEMVQPTHYDDSRVINNILGLITSFLILNGTVSATTGDISTAFGSLETEFYLWYPYITLIMVVFLINMFYRRR